MGRIKKAASSKHDATVSPALSDFASKACNLPLVDLTTHLSSFPRRWPFPRGDLYHWIDALDRFDAILEKFIDHYDLKSPQTKPFDSSFLVAEHGGDIQKYGFGPEADLELVQSILDFSKLLLEKCGNRSLYGSGDRLNCLLNTTSLSLVHSTLRLALCLAQRVNARQRPNSFTPGSAMLKNYYALELDNLQQLALPLRKPKVPTKSLPSATPVKTPKGKDRPPRPSNLRKSSTGIANANDLVRLATSNEVVNPTQAEWEPWAAIEVTAQKAGSESEGGGDDQDNVAMPDTPSRSSPLRRSSHVNGADTDSPAEESGRPPRSSASQTGRDLGSFKVNIEPEEIRGSTLEDLIKRFSPDLPPSSQYELLTRCRAAKALLTSHKSRQELLAVRLLAVSNLSYIYSEPWFQSRVMQNESEEPKRWQLVTQLAEILSYACTDTGIPLFIQTLALGSLRALAKHKSKLNEILTALSINVNHGALLSAIRKGLEDMAIDHDETDNEEGDEWREALFSLLHTLVLMSPPPSRSNDSFVPATMILRYVDVLNLRTEKAQRVYLRILEFFETFCNTVKDGLALLSANRAIEAIAELINFEVDSSLKQVAEGKGLAREYRTQSTDYSIPYFNQQTIRFLLPFIDGVIGQGGAAADRILRNLIDSPPFLEAIKRIMENPQAFGSHVWSSGIKLMSSFLHNEPTSYSVLAEAGLTNSFLSSIGALPPQQTSKEEAQSNEQINGDEAEDSSENADATMSDVESVSPTKTIDAAEKVGNAKVGILPSPEAISSVSQAFGAICLTTTGFNSFKASGALEIFFDIFQSPAHVKSMTEASYLQSIGNTFDELARHHPGLRMEILSTVTVMVARLRSLCKLKTLEVGSGTKLWVDGPSGKLDVAGGKESLIASSNAFESNTASSDYDIVLPNGNKLVVESAHQFGNLTIQKVSEDERDEFGLTISDYISPVMWFLLGFFENQSLCSSFIDYGGVELIMDIATAPSLPYDLSQDGNMGNSPLDMAQVIHMMADTKPHLVVPSLMHRIIVAVRSLEDFTTKQPNGAACFFDPLIGNIGQDSQHDEGPWVRENGTKLARSLASCLNLTRIFHEVYSSPMYHTRQSQQPSPFTHVNLVDRYVELCHRLGDIHAACVREAVMLQAKTPRAWKEDTRLKDFGTGIDEADEMLGLVRMPTTETNGNDEGNSDQAESGSEQDRKAQLEADKNTAAFRNVKILRSLLSQVPYTITQFLQLLGMGLVPKRRMDTNAKQNMTEVADAIAQALVQQFDPPFFRSAEGFPSSEKFREHKFAYLVVVLASLSAVTLDMYGASSHSIATTSVLMAVRKAHGIERVRALGDMFYEEVNEYEGAANKEASKSSTPSSVDISLSGLKMILNFFSLLTSSKTVVDTPQAGSLRSPDRDRPYCFVPSQLLLELRMEVLPLVRKIWANNNFIDRANKNTIEGLIFALKHILEGDSEVEAYKASDNVPPSLLPSPRRFMPNRDKMTHLKDLGYDEDLAREALFRCNNSRDASEEYCRAYSRNPRVPRNPPRASDLEASTPDPRSTPRRESSEMSASRSDSNAAPSFPSAPFNAGTAPLLRDILNMTTGLNVPEAATRESEVLSDSTNGGNAEGAEDSGPHMAMSLDNILNPGLPSADAGGPSQFSSAPETSESQPRRNPAVVTVEDIDAQREDIRSDLAERCLDVLNTHHNVTFELSELVSAASKRLSNEERADFRSTFGELLVNTVVSTRSELETQESTQSVGKRVAAHAHLLALLLQDKDMYSECLDALKDSFSDLVSFIKVSQAPDGKATEASSPWIGQVLLVFERMLSDDAEPRQIAWNPDAPDMDSATAYILSKDVVSPKEKQELFSAIIDVLPRVSKDTSLALSVARVLVALTRDRTIAAMLGEKRNLQRLFVMIKQLGGANNERLQGAFMIILRHIIEDDEILRQIMRSEIVANFENRANRQIDTTAYVRQMYHLVLRSPQIFVEVTNEKLKIQHYSKNQRPQELALKTEDKKDEASTTKAPATEESKAADQDQALETTEAGPSGDADAKARPNLKLPVVEHPDGVIHFLLSELLSYKDVEDKEVSLPQLEKDQSIDTTSDTESESAPADIAFPRSEASTPAPSTINKSEKTAFKAEDHPIYIYRCFILQCLTELLHSYNRTKIEFISFSRRADPSAVTPSKARSGVLNYFLQSLIPLKSMNHDDSHPQKKRLTVSDWAMRVIIALCSKTGELGTVAPRERYNWNFQGINDNGDEEELNIVREFVLQHAMKAFKDANASTEPLDAKYARMLGLAELFNKLLARPSLGDGEAGSNNNSYRIIGKMMFQKNFISLLTGSIADLDLNFAGSKRLAKAILKPLDQLTSTALQLSLQSDTIISSPLGHTEEDQISSASSVSEMDDEREETPDLFRNSALGMLDPNRQEESSSEEEEEEDDNEMYEEDYDDEMEYEEDMNAVGDDGEVISDEDVDDIQGRGPVEGLPGDVPLDLELVMEDEDGANTEDDEDDDEDDSEDDDEDLDEDDDIEIDEDEAIMAGEINGDDENASLADDDGDIEWESDHGDEDQDDDGDLDNDEADIDDVVDQATSAAGNPPGGPNANAGRLSNILQVLGGLPSDGGPLGEMLGQEMEEGMDEDDGLGPFFAHGINHADFLDNDDDDGDELDENDEDDAPYQTLEEILDDESSAPWAWDPAAPGPWHPRPHHHQHHHHHHFRGPGGFPTMGGAMARGLPIGSLGRTRHIHSTHSGNDDGTNPLLQRPSGTTPVPPIDVVPGLGGGFMVSSGPGSGDMFEMIMQAVQRGDGRVEMSQHGGRFDIRFDGVPSDFRNFMRGGPPLTPHGTPGDRNDPATAVRFRAAMTAARWQEEAKILYGAHYLEKIQRVVNSILRVLVPPAIEEEKARERQEEEARKREEEQREKERQEQLAREEAEKKRKEEEEREAAERAAAEVAAAAAEAEGASGPEFATPGDAEPMQDVQASSDVAEASAPSDSGPTESSDAVLTQNTPRVYTTIRGRQLDITDLAIDPQFLEELPEEIREEVIMQQYAEQRHQAQEQGQPPTDINSEFLDALPEEIREELLQQEAAERRRRERETARRRAADAGGPARAEEMDPDSFMASLDPSLRRSILADQPDEIIAGLAPEFAAEARQMFQGSLRHMNRIPREAREDQANPERQPQKEIKKQVVQMVDKAGVATLLRLMFMPHQGSARTTLHNILHSICEHRQTRGEVVSLLLLILQDGTADISAVERSLAHLSLRAKTASAQRTPQPLKRTLSMQPNQAGNEVTPIMIVQQCLAALESLTSYNPHISPVFLRELEPPSHKSRSAKKGKGKEDRASKFAINALLSLLDRSLITENASCMDTLAKLLLEITKPLPWLLKKDKPDESNEVQKVATGEKDASTTTEQPSANADQVAPPIAEAPTTAETDVAMTEAPLPGAESVEATGELQAPSGAADTVIATSFNEKQKTEQQKTRKLFEPPIIPEENLRLVVGVLAAREMNAKIFQNTLSTITYLSILPGAREVFGKELVSQAESLSQNILPDLNELLLVLQNAQSGPEVHGPAVERFTTPGADQSKFLRVLMAVDYLFSVKREEAKEKNEDQSSAEKEDFLNALYSSTSFGPVWSKLSECLIIIRQKEGMTSVSTILLSLIESLMVVCKNTSLKESLISRSFRERSVQSPVPESAIEDMFYNFTEEHRKVLNELVRMNPKLMTGNFSVLVKNPKVLEFDNKRSYFNRQVHTRPRDARHHQPPLQLSVRRDQVFLDSFKSLYFKSAEEMKYGKLSIRFHGEEGVDAGGVTREWFQVLARGMFNPNYALFIPVASDRTTFHPNRLSGVNNEHLMFFKFIGRIIGKALYEGRVLDCHFSRAVYKRILGKAVSIKDMETLDLDYYKSLVWMLENDITDIITETFSVETDDFGETQIIDLIENGRNIPVTEENKQEYVQLVVEYRLTGSVTEQLENFLKGFHDIIPAELISIFNEQELELLISGLPDIDIDDWKANTEYHNYSASSQQIQWFWRAVRSFDKEEQAKLLQFITGTSKVPLNGFKELEGMNGFSRFNIHKDYGNKDRLPSSHTCFNQLDLPEYDNYETLRQRLYMAMTAGSEYFGFA